MDPHDLRNTLWYQRPATDPHEALPLGNGRLGAMVTGDPEQETIVLNEETLWAGEDIQRQQPDGAEHLPEIREALFDGDPARAQALADEHLYSDLSYLRPYQPFGQLQVELGHDTTAEFCRSLDLATGISRTRHEHDGTRYTREAFVSAPDDVFVLRISAEESEALDVELSLDREREARSTAIEDTLFLRGQVINLPRRPEEVDHGVSGWGLRFEARARVSIAGERAQLTAEDGAITVSDADEIFLRLAATTDYDTDDPGAACKATLDAAADSIEDLREAHVTDHRERFERVSIDLGEPHDIPTDERLDAYSDGNADPHLEALLFQYGRHLLLASSRPGCLPANLQGIWNWSYDPPWDSKFTTNMNLEMNYWPAYVCNLAECADPLVEFVDSLRPDGRRTAEELYDCPGWTLHHNTDLWRTTVPVDTAYFGMWPMGAAWLCQHLWERYEFRRDDAELAELYPIMAEAAEFLLAFLAEDDAGNLVTAPSMSPENPYVAPDGSEVTIAIGPTMDVQLVSDLFEHVVEASEILGEDAAFAADLEAAIDRLPDHQTGSHGQLQEWRQDHEEADPGHRHTAHLYGHHPGNRITSRKTPALSEAVRTSIERRVEHSGGSTGWSRAWLICQFARLADGERARFHVRKLLEDFVAPNLFDLHPPSWFQIDGNLGFSAGIAEMLLQSHDDAIEPLPALPDAWANGSVRGLKARGGFEVDLRWSDHELDTMTVTAEAGTPCRLRIPESAAVRRNGTRIAEREGDSDVTVISTAKGDTITVENS